MIDLSAAAAFEKNRIESDLPWHVLLEVQFNDNPPTELRIVRNTENVIWNGYSWIAFPFELDMIGEFKKSEIPQFVVKISNVTGSLQKPLEDTHGGIGAVATLRVIHESSPSNVPEIELTYIVRSAQADAQWITFNLGARNIFDERFPKNTVLKNNCRFKFKSSECGYGGAEGVCNKTLSRCIELGNSSRFGGFPSVGRKGFVF